MNNANIGHITPGRLQEEVFHKYQGSQNNRRPNHSITVKCMGKNRRIEFCSRRPTSPQPDISPASTENPEYDAN